MTPMCKKCSRPVIWKRSVAGTEIELDAEPTPRVVLLASALCELVQTYSLHQDTCPAQNGHPKHRRRVSARVKP